MAAISTGTATADDAAPRVVEDCRGVLQVLSDGTIVRSAAAAVDVPTDPSVEWKDVIYDAALGLGLRVYKPAPADADGGGSNKLPVVVTFHGGGFCINSYAAPHFHAACSRLAAGTGALVLSADYRLAPEHRLPAAIDDAAAVLLWLRGQACSSPDSAGADPWLSELADPGRVFVTGESAGGVLAHHLNVRFSGTAAARVLHPVRLRGFVPMMPFFTGVETTPSERCCPDDAFLNRDMSARFMRLCLPPGDIGPPVPEPVRAGRAGAGRRRRRADAAGGGGRRHTAGQERGVREEDGGDGEACGARGVPGAGARLLLAPRLERAGGRAGACVQAVHGQGLLAPGFRGLCECALRVAEFVVRRGNSEGIYPGGHLPHVDMY